MMISRTAVALIFTLVNTFILGFRCSHERLKIETYNPQRKSMFPVTANSLFGREHTIQMDAQFDLSDGEKVAEIIKNRGLPLKLIIISCGDPDYYFGLQSIVKWYPDVKIVASRKVVDHIRNTKDEKLKMYKLKLGINAPTKLYVPQIANKTDYFIDGERLLLHSENNYAAYFWIPGLETVLGGVGVSSDIHVFTADTQTPRIRASWRKVLRKMISLKPKKVIPGHYLGTPPEGDEAIKFTLEYLEYYEEVLEKNHYKNSTAVIEAMIKKYPGLGLVSSLQLGAKVNTGEMQYS